MFAVVAMYVNRSSDHQVSFPDKRCCESAQPIRQPTHGQVCFTCHRGLVSRLATRSSMSEVQRLRQPNPKIEMRPWRASPRTMATTSFGAAEHAVLIWMGMVGRTTNLGAGCSLIGKPRAMAVRSKQRTLKECFLVFSGAIDAVQDPGCCTKQKQSPCLHGPLCPCIIDVPVDPAMSFKRDMREKMLQINHH